MRNFAAKQKTDKEVALRFRRCLYAIAGILVFAAIAMCMLFLARSYLAKGALTTTSIFYSLSDSSLGTLVFFMFATFEKVVQIKFSNFKLKKAVATTSAKSSVSASKPLPESATEGQT
jgi:hypothetical protein